MCIAYHLTPIRTQSKVYAINSYWWIYENIVILQHEFRQPVLFLQGPSMAYVSECYNTKKCHFFVFETKKILVRVLSYILNIFFKGPRGLTGPQGEPGLPGLPAPQPAVVHPVAPAPVPLYQTTFRPTFTHHPPPPPPPPHPVVEVVPVLTEEPVPPPPLPPLNPPGFFPQHKLKRDSTFPENG